MINYNLKSALGDTLVHRFCHGNLIKGKSIVLDIKDLTAMEVFFLRRDIMYFHLLLTLLANHLSVK